MDDKIKEVMGLVDFYAEMYKEFPDWGDHSQRDVNSARQAIESKLRELVQPSTVGLTFDQWFQLRLDSLRRQNEWRKIDCLLASKEYVRDAWEVNAVPDGHVVVPINITEEMHVAAVKTIRHCTGNDDFPPRVYSAMLSAAPKETK